MRKIENGEILTYNEITAKYENNYSVVEVLSRNPEIGEYKAKVLWLCDNFEEALKLSVSYDDIEALMLPGDNCYSIWGGCFV